MAEKYKSITEVPHGSERSKAILDKEGWRVKGYFPTKSSGISIGYGIDLKFQTVDSLVSLGIDKKRAEQWESKGYLGKDYYELEKAGINPDSAKLHVNIPNTPELQNSMKLSIFSKQDKEYSKYAEVLSPSAYISLMDFTHFSGGKGAESSQGYDETDPYKRKAHATYELFSKLDKHIEDFPGESIPNQLVIDAFQSSSDELNNAGSPKNAGRFAGYVEDIEGQKEHSILQARIDDKESLDKKERTENIKNKDNLEYLRRRAQQGSVELSDSDVELVANVAEDQRVKWTQLGVPSVSDVILNATGIQQNKIGVDDDATNEIHRAMVVEALSEGIDVNTIDGKKVLRQRLKSYAELVKSDGWTEKVDALAGGIRETSYQNMIEDLSFDYRTLIVDANKIHKLEGDEKIDYEDAVRVPDEEGVISDNKATIQAEINKGNTELSKRVAKEGLDAIALELAKIQQDAAESGDLDTDAITLLSIAEKEKDINVRDKSLKEGIERGEALALEDDDTDEEEEQITTTFDLWKKDNPDGTLEQWMALENDPSKGENDLRNRRMRNAEKALTGLKASAGILSLSQALAEPDIETPELSPLIQEALHKQSQLAKSGLTAKEKSAAMQNLNNAYAGAMKNVLRASGGQRGLYLANQGTVDANRIAGLNQLAAEDAKLHRENIKQYNALATSVGQMKLQRDMNVEQMRQATLNNNRQILSGIGTNLLSDAISDVGYYLNPNREATEALTKRLLEGSGSSTYDNPYLNKDVNTATITSEEKKQKEEQEELNENITE